MAYKNLVKLSVILIFHWMIIGSLSAKEWIVNNSNDSGAGSLREALLRCADDDMINIIGVDTIQLTSDQITINKSVTISGNNAIISRNKAMALKKFRIINIVNPVTVKMENITIANGIGPCIDGKGLILLKGGGGIYLNNELGKLSLINCTLRNNTTQENGDISNYDGGGGYGGGLLIENGKVELIGCKFCDNSTGNGVDGLNGGTGGSGAGIYLYTGTLDITDSEFINNHTGYGSNVTGGSGGEGGAIFKLFGELKITNTRFKNNFTGSGGGGSFKSMGEYGNLHYGSGKGGDGGAIEVQNGNTLIDNCIFDSNHTGNGGTAQDIASAGDGGSGGAILHGGGKLDVRECTFTANRAGDAGNSGKPELTYCKGGLYCGGGSGGALFTRYASVYIYNCVFDGNASGHGGNNKKNGSGGAFYLGSGGYDDFMLVGSLFINNYTSRSEGSTGGGFGGAVYLNSWTGKIYNSTFAKNESSDNGGAVYFYGGGSIYNSIITLNKARDLPNDLATASGSVTLYNSLVTNTVNLGSSNAIYKNCLSNSTAAKFRNADNNDFSLLPTSHCINGGDKNYNVNISPITTDLKKHPRIRGEIVDIGAYEYFNETCNEDYKNITSSVCAGDYYQVGDSIYTKAGKYVNILYNKTGCDSIVILNLSINPIPQINLGKDTTINQSQFLYFSRYGNFKSIIWNDTISSNYYIVDSKIGTGTHPIWVKITDLNGCTSSDTVLVTLVKKWPDTLPDTYSADNMIYPNPTKGVIHVQLQENKATGIEIFDLSGNPVMIQETLKDSEIDLTNYPNGTYLVRILSGGKLSMQCKILKN